MSATDDAIRQYAAARAAQLDKLSAAIAKSSNAYVRLLAQDAHDDATALRTLANALAPAEQPVGDAYGDTY